MGFLQTLVQCSRSLSKGRNETSENMAKTIRRSVVSKSIELSESKNGSNRVRRKFQASSANIVTEVVKGVREKFTPHEFECAVCVVQLQNNFAFMIAMLLRRFAE